MFEELSSKYSALLACGNTGVLVAIAKACLRMKSKQMQFVQVLFYYDFVLHFLKLLYIF